MVPRRGKSAQIAVAPLVAISLFLFIGESGAFCTSSRYCGSRSEINPKGYIVASYKNDKRSRQRNYMYDPDSYDGRLIPEKMQKMLRPLKQKIKAPTETETELIRPKTVPDEPKIVVLGATGKVGRHVIWQLMERENENLEILALVRNHTEAVHLFFGETNGKVTANVGNQRGPKLKLVTCDLVPPEDLPGFVSDQDRSWKRRAKSAADFFGNKIEDYDNGKWLSDVDEVLGDCIRDCTTIISCIGSVRPTHLWHDILAVPFIRLLKADVSSWCKDKRHPFYVTYASTRKVLGFAEREQVRRETAAAAIAESEGLDPDKVYVPRIRFVRLSNWCVQHKPWDIIPVIVNTFRSLAIRYHEMAEQLLGVSSIIETVVLRSGDLVDEERDVEETKVQVSSSGRVRSPSYISTEDVAKLTISAATFLSRNNTDGLRTSEPFHYTFGCRWVGQTLDSYPLQGHKRDGHSDAKDAFSASLEKIHRKAREQGRKKKQRKSKISRLVSSSDLAIRMVNQVKKTRKNRQRQKPYGIFVVLPVYTFLLLLSNRTLIPLLRFVPGGKQLIIPFLNRVGHLLAMKFNSILSRLLLLLSSVGRKPISLF